MASARILYQVIEEVSNLRPAAPAILAPGKGTLTYGELTRHLQRTALKLSQCGIRRGSRLAVVLPNGPEMATAFLAITSVCTCAPLNPSYPVEEFKFSLKDLRIDALVISAGGHHPAREAAAALEMPVIELLPDPQKAGIFDLAWDRPVDDSQPAAVLAEEGDTALVLHTSGTTSRPKIVPLTQRNLSSSVQAIAGTYALAPTDRALNMMPLFHVHGLLGAAAASLASGGSVVCTPGIVPDQVLEWLIKLKPTWYTAVPTLHQAVLEQARQHPELAKQVHLRFIRSCSSALAPQLAQDLESTFTAPVLEAYGMTEAAHQIASSPLPPQPRKYASVGLPTGTTRVCILDDKGGTLPENSVGEICIRGENVTQGYENNPQANAAGFTNGWLRTGDRGYLDEDGYVFIQGRQKELINRGGEKISPREVDEVLLQHPAVSQAVAFAIPHPSLGEDVAAAVVLREDRKVSVRELRQFVLPRLAEHKVPRLIVFLSELPKGPTGKIQRIGLAEKLKAELEAAKASGASGESAPRDPAEAKILTIWRQVLDQPEIGCEDDLIAQGVNSIMTARALTLINDHFDTDLSISDVFNAPTVAMLADLIQEKRNKPTPP